MKATPACYQCRLVKRRCDHESPCGNCLKHGVECVYLESKKRWTRNVSEYSKWTSVMSLKQEEREGEAPERIQCFGVSSHTHLMKWVMRNYPPWLIKRALISGEENLKDVWYNVIHAKPIKFTSWKMILLYFRISSVFSTTLCIIKEEQKSNYFEKMILRILGIIEKNMIPLQFEGYFARILLFLSTEGKLRSEKRCEVLDFIEKHNLLERYKNGTKRDKVISYGGHFIQSLSHPKDVGFHLSEVKYIESQMSIDIIPTLYFKYSLLDYWSLEVYHHGLERLETFGVTIALFHQYLSEFALLVEKSVLHVYKINPDWNHWYRALLEAKWAIFYAYVLRNPQKALVHITNILDMKLCSICRHLGLHFPILMDICTLAGATKYSCELKSLFANDKEHVELYYMKQDTTLRKSVMVFSPEPSHRLQSEWVNWNFEVEPNESGLVEGLNQLHLNVNLSLVPKGDIKVFNVPALASKREIEETPPSYSGESSVEGSVQESNVNSPYGQKETPPPDEPPPPKDYKLIRLSNPVEERQRMIVCPMQVTFNNPHLFQAPPDSQRGLPFLPISQEIVYPYDSHSQLPPTQYHNFQNPYQEDYDIDSNYPDIDIDVDGDDSDSDVVPRFQHFIPETPLQYDNADHDPKDYKAFFLFK